MKVLVVDDDALIRDSLKMLIGLEDDIEVVGVAKNGEEAIELTEKNNPDIILMDIRMPVMDGVLATKNIKAKFKSTKIIILTTFKDDEYIKEAIRNGAEGYILKNQPVDSIIEAIRAVNKGNTVFEKEVISKITNFMDTKIYKKYEDYGLTSREIEILELIAEGFSNKEIGEKIFLSDGTIRNNVSILLSKLDLRDRTQLAIFYLKNFRL